MYGTVYDSLFDSLSKGLKEHSIRTGMLSEMLAKVFIEELSEIYRDISREEILNAIRSGGVYHDMGKSMFSEMTLESPNKLTYAEKEAIKWHPTRSAELVSGTDEFKKLSHTGKKIVLDCCFYHHERFDGSGYPYALTGRTIPLVAQIVSLCDMLDALCSKRSYKEGLSFSESYRIIIEQKGKAFHNELIEGFDKNIKEMKNFFEFTSCKKKSLSLENVGGNIQ